MNETHNGNKNRSTAPAPAKKQGTASAGKSNGPEATLRAGSMPKAEAVTTVDPNKNKGAALKAGRRQNTSDEKTWPHGRNVIPNEGDNSLLTHPAAAELQ